MVLLLRQNSETMLAPRLPRNRPPNRHESLALLGNQSLSRYIDVATLPRNVDALLMLAAHCFFFAFWAWFCVPFSPRPKERAQTKGSLRQRNEPKERAKGKPRKQPVLLSFPLGWALGPFPGRI